MVVGDAGGNVLQQHGLAGLRRRDDEATLALAERRAEVDDPGGHVLGAAVAALELQARSGVQRREVLEQNLVASAFRHVEVDLAHLGEGEIALAFLRRTDETRQAIARAQVEATNLTRADVDVVGASQVTAVCRTQEAETVGKNFEYAIAVDVLAISGVGLQQGEDDILFALTGNVVDAERFAHAYQFGDGPALEVVQTERATDPFKVRRTDDAKVLAITHVLRQTLMVTTLVAVVATTAIAATVAAAVAATRALHPTAATAAAALVAAATTAAALVAQITPHRFWSRNAANWALLTKPTFCACGTPFLNSMSMGMLRTPNLVGVTRLWSTSIFAMTTRPA